MKTRQPEFRAIPQVDCGRWKLRLERLPVDPVNETTMGMDFDSAAQARVNEINEAHWFLLQSSAADANDKHQVERILGGATDSETGANNSEPVPAESLNQPMIMPKRTGAEKSKFLKCRSSEA